MSLESLPYTLAMQTREEDAQRVDQRIGAEVVRRDDGALLALLTDKWQVRGLRHHHPDIVLEPIVAQSPDV